MAMLEDAADNLAKRTMQHILETGSDDIEKEVKAAIGSSSPTLEEAFATAMRIRRAEARALAVLDEANPVKSLPGPSKD